MHHNSETIAAILILLSIVFITAIAIDLEESDHGDISRVYEGVGIRAKEGIVSGLRAAEAQWDKMFD